MGHLDHFGVAALTRRSRDLRATLEMIQFEHTLFALPFAFTGAVLAARSVPGTLQTIGILLAMVGARSAAMTFNRLVDLPYDVRNPRTARRPLVTGALSRRFAWLFLTASSLLFVLAAAMLNRVAFALSFPVLALILGYSYAKRFTSGTHFLLGASLGCAPLGGWIGVKGQIGLVPVVLGFSVLCWTAGFDIIYACQDAQFDLQAGLHSIPRRWGVRSALVFSRVLHTLMLLGLLVTGRLLSLGLFFHFGVALAAVLLVYEHSLVRADDLSRVNRAFFVVNGYISIILFLLTLADVYWSR